jgi:hypothetical protein
MLQLQLLNAVLSFNIDKKGNAPRLSKYTIQLPRNAEVIRYFDEVIKNSDVECPADFSKILNAYPNYCRDDPFYEIFICPVHKATSGTTQSIYCVTGRLLGVDFCNSGVFHRLAHFANSFIMTSSSFARVVKRYSTLGGISG